MYSSFNEKRGGKNPTAKTAKKPANKQANVTLLSLQDLELP